MKPVIFFTDTAKDGDDFIATVNLTLQATAAGVIQKDIPDILVTSDEIPCDANGKQNPEGKYGLRALYLNMYLEKLRHQSPGTVYPQIIPGPITSHYKYDAEKKKYYNESSASDAFYPTQDVEQYYSKEKAPDSCLLNTDKPDAWIEKVKQNTPEGATLLNLASFDGVNDFLAQLTAEERKKYSLISMGYNQPYSNNDEYQNKIKNPNTLPYNARSTDPKKAVPAIQTMMEITDSFHIASGTTRVLPKYDQSTWLSSFMEIMSRSYLLLSMNYSEVLSSASVKFIKQSKYQSFWPHDVVASLMMIIEQGNWEGMHLPQLRKDLLFTQIERVPAAQLHMRMVDNTGVLIDQTIPAQDTDAAIGKEGQSFVYGKELDAVFFTSLLHYIAIEALPRSQKPAYSNQLNYYKAILELKSKLYDLKQQPEINKATILNTEQEIKSIWAIVCLIELQRQLSLVSENKLSEDMQFILGSQSKTFSLYQFTPEQGKSLNMLIAAIIDWSSQSPANINWVNENLLQWLKSVAEYMQVTKKSLTPDMLKDITNALPQVPAKANLSPLTTALFYRLREELFPTATALNLLRQEGQPGVEYKRTGNSLIYAEMSLGGNLAIPFPKGVFGISEAYKNLLSLKNQSESHKLAFKLHLAIHDAGKGDMVKNAVRMNNEGTYFIRLPNNTYYKLKNNRISLARVKEFNAAKAHVDHDAALHVFGLAGAKANKCSPTEFLIWGKTAPVEVDKEAIRICDELIPLCNEMNIAQIIQGEIPFAGIKKGLDLFFAAYQKDPKIAELVFAHHCFDIYGAAPLDSFSSISAGQPEVQLKIELLYKTLVSVAQESNNPDPSKTAFQLYRQKLAKAIPEITPVEDLAVADEQEIIAKTRVAQMLRCHLFKVQTDEKTKQISIAKNGSYEQRTRLFVESIKESFNLLTEKEQVELIEILTRNDSADNKAVIMVMYGPKLFLTATTGTEFAPKDPEDKAVISTRLTPMLRLYVKLYNLQAQHATQYSVIEIGELAQILERVFTYYKECSSEQKQTFADLLFTLQQTGKAKEFLNKLPLMADIKSKSAQEQLLIIQETLKSTNVSFELPQIAIEAPKESTTLISKEPVKQADDSKLKPLPPEVPVANSERKAEPVTKEPAKQPEIPVISKTPEPIRANEQSDLLPTPLPPKVPVHNSAKIGPATRILMAINRNKETLNKRELHNLLMESVLDLSQDLTVDMLNYLFNSVKNIKELNTHTNPNLDRFFGIKNTESWRDTLGVLRKFALEKLFKELETIDSDEDKLAFLEDAKKLPLFCEHRNNSIFTGAWGRTNSVRLIEEKEAEIRQFNLVL